MISVACVLRSARLSPIATVARFHVRATAHVRVTGARHDSVMEGTRKRDLTQSTPLPARSHVRTCLGPIVTYR